MKKGPLNLLYRSFDLDLSEKELKVLGDSLAASEDLNREKTILKTIRSGVIQARHTGENPFFVDGVMARIAAMEGPADRENMLETMIAFFKPALVFGVLVLAVVTLLNFGLADRFAPDKGIAGQISLPDDFVEETVNNFLEDL